MSAEFDDIVAQVSSEDMSAAAAQVDIKDTAARVERLLQRRPERSELVSRAILKEEFCVAPSLQRRCEQLRWNQRSRELQRHLCSRPSKQELVARGIVRTPLWPCERMTLARETAYRLEHALTDRPCIEVMYQSGTLPSTFGNEIRPVIYNLQEKLKHQEQSST